MAKIENLNYQSAEDIEAAYALLFLKYKGLNRNIPQSGISSPNIMEPCTSRAITEASSSSAIFAPVGSKVNPSVKVKTINNNGQVKPNDIERKRKIIMACNGLIKDFLARKSNEQASKKRKM